MSLSCRGLVVLFVCVGAYGCNHLPGAAAPHRGADAWVARWGGVAEPSLVERAERAARRVADGTARRVLVADDFRVGAWIWPDGSAVVTRRVVETLDDDELVAVFAHEAAHLESEGGQRPPALTGMARRDRVERAADRQGREILRAHGVDPAAMCRMLRAVATAVGASTSDGSAMLRRAVACESS